MQEIDVTKLGIAQLHQVYGELTIQLEFLAQKANQVKAIIVQKAGEMQRAQQEQASQLNQAIGTAATHPELKLCETNCCKETNGLAPEVS